MPPPPLNLNSPDDSDHNARSSKFDQAVLWFATGTAPGYSLGAVQSNAVCPVTDRVPVPAEPEHGVAVGAAPSATGTQPADESPPSSSRVVLHNRRVPPLASTLPVRTNTR